MADRVRLACVDVGSNTTRLLVAEPIPSGLRGLHNERLFTLIGRSIDAKGRIPADKIDETAAAVANQAERARRMGAEAVRVVATAAIRRAENAAELAEAVEQRAGVPLIVLSGDDEARLAYVGASQALGGSGSLVVVDVGGGSTEIAFGDSDGRIVHSTSVMIGTSTLAERHLIADPPSPDQVAAAREEVVQAFADLETRPVDRAAAIGGSASSLEHLAGRELGPVEIAEALDTLQRESAWDVGARYELDPERVRLLPAGLLVLEQLTRRLQLPLRICKGGLREGVIIEMIESRR